MSSKSDFTPEAWEQLKAGPLAAAMYVMTAAPSALGVFSEMGALAKGMQAAAAQAPAGTLIGSLLAELDSKAQQTILGELKPKFGVAQQDVMSAQLALVEAAGAAIGPASPDDAGAYRNLVLTVARGVAEAAKDDGVPVSPREEAALAQIAGAIGAA